MPIEWKNIIPDLKTFMNSLTNAGDQLNNALSKLRQLVADNTGASSSIQISKENERFIEMKYTYNLS